MVVRRHEGVAVTLVRDGLADRVEREDRVTREVHLRDQALRERVPEQREVDVRGTPRVTVVAPRIGARLDRGEPVRAVSAGQAATEAREVRVDRRVVLLRLVDVTAGRVGLPDLDELARDRSSVTIDDAAADGDPLADRPAAVVRVPSPVGAQRQVGLERVDVPFAEAGRPELNRLRVGVPQLLGRVPQDARRDRKS